MDATLRLMTATDIPAGLELCRASGWNQTARDWELLLTLAPAAAFVAELEGDVVGTVIAVPYRPAFDWVAMMLVQESLRGRGIGRALMNRAVATSTGAVRLDATSAGRHLYVTLGFEDESTLSRWRGSAAMGGAAARSTRPIRENDWDDIAALDRPAFGADRVAALRWCWQEAPEYGWLVRDHGRLEGYVLGRHGHGSEHIGPLVGSRPEVADDLLGSCLARSTARPVTIDVPDAQEVFRVMLEKRGFAVHRAFTRMVRGSLRELPRESDLFAATGPELG